MIRGRTTGTPWRFRPTDFLIWIPLALALSVWDEIKRRTWENYR